MSDSKQTCESCGTKFSQSNEVVSSRILCPPCAEKRRAALRAAKQAGTAPAAANPSASATAAPGKGAVVSQPAAPAAPAPAMRVSRPARTAAVAVRREAEDTKPASERPSRAGRGPNEHLDIKRLKAEQQARMMKIGWGVTGAVALIVGIILLFVSNKKESIKEANAAYEKSLDDFKSYMLGVNLESESALKQAKEKFASERKLYKGSRIELDVTTHMQKINASLAMLEKTRSLKEQLEGLEKQLANPTPETLERLFTAVRGAEITQQAEEFQGELKTRLDTLRKSASERYIDVLRANATAAAGATTGEGLAPFGQLEDTLRVVIEEARAANDVEVTQKYTPVYLGVIREVNDIVARLFDDAYIQKQKAIDTLTDTGGWTVIEKPSFQHRFGGGLTLTNAAGDTAESGGLTYTAGRGWRDYVIDMEVQVDSGELVFYTRIGDKMDSKLVPSFTMGAKTGLNVLAEAGKSYKVTVRVIGKEFAVLVDGSQQHGDAELAPTKSRKGEPGIVAKAGTNAKITKLSVKHLR